MKDHDIEWLPAEIRPKALNFLAAFIGTQAGADVSSLVLGKMTEPTMEALEIEEEDDQDKFHEEPPEEKPGCFASCLISLGLKKKQDGRLLQPSEKEVSSLS